MSSATASANTRGSWPSSPWSNDRAARARPSAPFYTTKAEGSGIGLALSRQIAEAHGGTLTLVNRSDHQGCEARLSLPTPAR